MHHFLGRHGAHAPQVVDRAWNGESHYSRGSTVEPLKQRHGGRITQVEPLKYSRPKAAPHSSPIDGPPMLGFGVQVASIAENEGGGLYAYRCSKIAANMATKSMSIDLDAKGITCTILHPGYVRTDMTNGNGYIDKEESVEGMLTVLESGVPLNGEWYHTSGRHLPW
jgi:NAD(P)-dependent dehydrogenase (short-subunit alcohol dehydrogenase family)